MGQRTCQVIVSSGQYEQSAITVTVKYTTIRGLVRRMRQLSEEHAVHGDNWAGWIKANVAIASENDRWGDNQISRRRWCNPSNGWLGLYGNEFDMSIDDQLAAIGIKNQ